MLKDNSQLKLSLSPYQGIYEVEGNTPKYVGAFKIENGKVVKVN